jgi:outer membrane cobalamin receptor
VNPNHKLSCAVCSVLGIQTAAAASAIDTSGGNSEGLSEIIVTAQRREEKLQNVPVTVQVLSAETIAELNVHNLDQFIKSLPNVTQSTNGPPRATSSYAASASAAAKVRAPCSAAVL